MASRVDLEDATKGNAMIDGNNDTLSNNNATQTQGDYAQAGSSNTSCCHKCLHHAANESTNNNRSQTPCKRPETANSVSKPPPMSNLEARTMYQSEFQMKDACRPECIRRTDCLTIRKGIFSNSTLYQSDFVPIEWSKPRPIRPRDNLVVGTFYRSDKQEECRKYPQTTFIHNDEKTEI